MLSKVISFISGSVLTFSFMNYAYEYKTNDNLFLKNFNNKENDDYVSDIVL